MSKVIRRGKELREKIGLGVWGQDALVRCDPTFPRPFPINGKSLGWDEDALDEWIKRKQAEANTPLPRRVRRAMR